MQTSKGKQLSKPEECAVWVAAAALGALALLAVAAVGAALIALITWLLGA